MIVTFTSNRRPQVVAVTSANPSARRQVCATPVSTNAGTATVATPENRNASPCTSGVRLLAVGQGEGHQPAQPCHHGRQVHGVHRHPRQPRRHRVGWPEAENVSTARGSCQGRHHSHPAGRRGHLERTTPTVNAAAPRETTTRASSIRPVVVRVASAHAAGDTAEPSSPSLTCAAKNTNAPTDPTTNIPAPAASTRCRRRCASRNAGRCISHQPSPAHNTSPARERKRATP